MDLVVADAVDFYRGSTPNTLDGSVEDPPSGIGFMGLDFDADRGGRAQWIAWLAERQRARLEAHKPGALAFTWSLPRTHHWTATALEDAGWEIRHVVPHVHGQGYPGQGRVRLKPAVEFWTLTRKPIQRGLTVAKNVERWGTGELNIDACRVPRNWDERGESWKRSGHSAKRDALKIGGAPAGNGIACHPDGGWPTDFWMSHCPECIEIGIDKAAQPHCVAACYCGGSVLAPAGGDPPPCQACGAEQWWACPVAEMDQQSGILKSGARAAGVRKGLGYHGGSGDGGPAIRPSSGGASRFYPTFRYQAKAPGSERAAGCAHLLWALDDKSPLGWRRVDRVEYQRLLDAEDVAFKATGKRPTLCAVGNIHATVKPLDLCRYMAMLVKPHSQIVPIPHGANGFCGSGSEAISAALIGWKWSACDTSADAIEIARARWTHWSARERAARPTQLTIGAIQ